ncbi:DUF4011 domain-containing protein [Bacillus sp. OV166]|uniref:DUF4011 domain-containing protein n=1 Tax=Bacillus sp. OV166 TaxID=1882763 RepID=UPI0015C4FC4F|nr:DUF4011 domain-containing protein [Bacillus sp. OV166]
MDKGKMELKINNWKSRLIDLTKRNRLLNFKASKSSTLELDGDIKEIFNVFSRSKGIMVSSIVDINKMAQQLTTKTAKVNLTKDPDQSDADIKYQQNLEKVRQSLEKKLNGIRLLGKSSIEEKGINTLYLTMGFLKWTEVEYSKDIFSSPIILIPITLKRETARDPYYIFKLDEDIVFNPVLEQKLKLDFGVSITPIEQLDYENIEEILHFYEQELKLEKSWEVTDDSYIGVFSFSKLVMYKDFEQYQDTVESHPIIQELAGVKHDEDICGREKIVSIKEFDRSGKSLESYQILDADSSQQKAILAAKNGVSFVMQGPPGTGKSQTITNIIAETLAQGKKILFVSEKKAALDVVKKRISDKGLDDFCLDLHSHNSNKKAVLEELRHSLTNREIPRRATGPLTDLDFIKKHLNDYVDALHTVINPLECSTHTILGRLSKLNDVIEVLFELPNIDSYSSEKLNKVLKQIKDIETYRDVLSNEEVHIWFGTLIEENSFESESEIKAKFTILSKKLFELYVLFEEAFNFVNFQGLLTLTGLDELLKLGEMLSLKPEIPQVWYIEGNNKILYEAKDSYKGHQVIFEGYLQLRESLSQQSKEEILEQDLSEVNNVILNGNNETINDYIDTYKDFINNLFSNEQLILDKVAELKLSLDTVNKASLSIKSQLQMNGLELTPEKINEIELISNYITNNSKPTQLWFDSVQREVIENTIVECKEVYDKYLFERKIIEDVYLPELVIEDIDGMLDRFINEYSSFMRIFNKNYKRDKNLLKSLKRNKESIKVDEIIKDLRSLKRLKELQNEIDSKRNQWKEMFGEIFQQEKTDWERVTKVLTEFYALIAKLKDSENKAEFEKFLLSYQTEDKQNLFELSQSLNNQLVIIDQSLDELEKVCFSRITNIKSQDQNLLVMIPKIDELEKGIQRILDAKGLLSKFLFEQSFNFDQINALVLQINKIKDVQKEVDEQRVVFNSLYGQLYKGIDTDWKLIEESINWTIGADNNFNGRFPEKFIDVINNNSKLEHFLSQCEQLKAKKKDLTEDINFYTKIFPLNLIKYENNDFLNTELRELSSILKLFANSTHKLQQWIVSQRVKAEAVEGGLTDFLHKVLMEQTNNLYQDIFLKRFYKLWLDSTYKKLPILKRFDLKTHLNYINDFKNLDENLLESNSSRLTRKLLKKKEDYLKNIQYKSNDLAILTREIQKQKRHKPIRKLFSEIPQLLLTLKPCMMMSPLSVSQFIDPNSIKFDLIIFDEASQIRPEDAIGSLMRGNQVIIAGDDKQLPPTSFFAQQIEMDDEFINEEEEEAYESFESILDESLLIMPPMFLKWHYRSKHESLIAFSNREIYKNELYTFPSSTNEKRDGISHVYVENGLYDRGRSKKNLNEAARVAELVINHFKETPERTLGVIAFNQYQQEAIRDKLDELTRNNPVYEALLNEEKMESFFVKNLENVQGDERDTIILSVNFGKDSNGILHYNFGPLNNDGGERRLNVAITRAKYELIVVSSIKHSDLDDSRLKKKGPQLFKKFLYFAQTSGEFNFNDGIMNNGEFDSPFEEDVYDTLIKAGLEIRNQIGCSGYRIDMAVVDPDNPGRYLLGIECDGATYHSTKTARDRDRLRQSVLESLGWEIYRIWSQDWVKRKTEITKEIVEMVTEKVQI